MPVELCYSLCKVFNVAGESFKPTKFLQPCLTTSIHHAIGYRYNVDSFRFMILMWLLLGRISTS